MLASGIHFHSQKGLMGATDKDDVFQAWLRQVKISIKSYVYCMINMQKINVFENPTTPFVKLFTLVCTISVSIQYKKIMNIYL